MDFNTWDVKIQGESTLDFIYQFLEGSFIQIPITGDPIQGTLIFFLVRWSSDKTSVNELYIFFTFSQLGGIRLYSIII